VSAADQISASPVQTEPVLAEAVYGEGLPPAWWAPHYPPDDDE
jgi:hypothetical protein